MGLSATGAWDRAVPVMDVNLSDPRPFRHRLPDPASVSAKPTFPGFRPPAKDCGEYGSFGNRAATGAFTTSVEVGRLIKIVEPDMTNFRICGLFLAAATLLLVTAAQAAVVVAPLEGRTSITKVAQGCGPGGWRGPYGRCHWGYARHCWRGPYGGLHCG
jgi:hypothetical protein